MRILFVGDVVGRTGRAVVAERLPGLIRDWKLDCVIINGENAAGGFGITETIYNDFIEAGGGWAARWDYPWGHKEERVFIRRPPRGSPPGETSARQPAPRPRRSA